MQRPKKKRIYRSPTNRRWCCTLVQREDRLLRVELSAVVSSHSRAIDQPHVAQSASNSLWHLDTFLAGCIACAS